MPFVKFFQGKEAEFRDRLLVGAHLGGGELALMNDAQMDRPDGIGVVIQQRKGSLNEATLDRKFLLEFAHQRALVGGGIKGLPQTVAVIDVTSDPYGTFLKETLLTGSAAAAVMKELSPGGHNDIGNELLERGILLGLGTGDKEMIPLLQKDGKVSADFGIQAVEGPETIEE